MKINNKILLIALLSVAIAVTGSAQKKNSKIDVGEALKGYFKPVTTPSASPDANGFIRRWMMLEPISKPNSTNRVFTDSYTRENLSVEYFPGQYTVIPKDGDKVKVCINRLRGRKTQLADKGVAVVSQFAERMLDIADIETPVAESGVPGRNINIMAMLAPKKKK